MTLFGNLFKGPKGETALFTDRNPFFAASNTAAHHPTARASTRQEERSPVNIQAEFGTESVRIKVAGKKTDRATKRRLKELVSSEPPQVKAQEEHHVEDVLTETREQGGKQKKNGEGKGVRLEGQNVKQPGHKKRKKAPAQPATLNISDSVQHKLGSTGDRHAEEAGPSQAEEAKAGASDDAIPTADTLKRTIFVGNLPQGTVSKDLKKLFKRFGSIESVRIRSLAATPDVKMSKALQVKAGKTDDSKGSINAYVLFSTAEHADAAHALNMTQFNGQHIRVDKAAPPKESESSSGVQYDARRSVFVGNLPRDVQEEHLIRVFNSGDDHPALEGSVEAVRVVRDRHCRVGKGIAYILFRTKVAALAALRMHGSDCGGREMRVMRVQSSSNSGAGKGGKRLQSKKMLPGGGAQKTSKDGTPKKDKSLKSTSQPAKKKKQRNHKRPAVAARKKAALGAQS